MSHLYQVTVVSNPTLKAIEELGEEIKIILPPVAVVADSESDASAKVSADQAAFLKKAGKIRFVVTELADLDTLD